MSAFHAPMKSLGTGSAVKSFVVNPFAGLTLKYLQLQKDKTNNKAIIFFIDILTIATITRISNLY
ncbi:MAG: hypothetical protein M0D53_10540 [Flavobacterium sp. JAD_PAG50586_2]|nr:MAG: hypothetical protein M0D53_10540 [Flavobacterium sp. JAD_PAG50586_2]